MSDAAALRAEIKSWEKEFKAQNGRAATIEDIKQRPQIEDKYKLYKRLSKQKQVQDQPSTPPRAPALLASKSRVVQETEPLHSFNPFSPTKPKRKVDIPTTTPRKNLFATPKKSKPKARSTTPDDPFQDDVPLHQPTSPVSRARKRLRGEPVSPSPAKDKRRRLVEKDTPRTRDSSPSSGSPLPATTPVQAYIEDTPVKPQKGGRAFQGLFDEEPIPPVSRLEFSALSSTFRTQPIQASHRPIALLKEQSKLLKKKGTSDNTKDLLKGVRIPMKSNLFDARDNQQATTSAVPKDAGAERMDLDTESNANRMVGSHKLVEDEQYPKNPNALPISHPQLLPPSPPPSESIQNGSHKTGRAKVMGLKGKTRQVDGNGSSDEDGEDSSGEGLAIRYVEEPLLVKDVPEDEDEDPAAGVIRSQSPRIDNVEDDGHFDISAVPASLLSILAISPSSKAKEEQRLYRGLIYGRREGHYDPTCGGEIWGVGENSEPDDEGLVPKHSEEEINAERDGNAQPAWRKAVDIEDDEWEGEPVPWEVGEL